MRFGDRGCTDVPLSPTLHFMEIINGDIKMKTFATIGSKKEVRSGGKGRVSENGIGISVVSRRLW